MRKPVICICENKDADLTAQLISAFELIQSCKLLAFSVTVQAGFCRTWSETQIVGFLMHRLIFFLHSPRVSAVRTMHIAHERSIRTGQGCIFMTALPACCEKKVDQKVSELNLKNLEKDDGKALRLN